MTCTALVVTGQCRTCHTTDQPLTATGHCPTCADQATGDGDGDRVGLPVPAKYTQDSAVAALLAHVDHDPQVCIVRALATTTCGECDESPGPDTPDGCSDGWHRMAGPFVAVGCEGYLEPAARAALLA